MGKHWTKVLLEVYHTPEDLGIMFSGNGAFIEKALAKEKVPYVETSAEEEIYRRLVGGQKVVVRGPKGDGVSVATSAALARQILLDRAVVVDVLLRNGFSDGAAELRKITNLIKELGRKPILYLDISRLWQYPLDPWTAFSGYMPHGLDRLIDALEDVEAVFEDGEVATVVVLSNDLYEVMRRRLKKHVVVEASSDSVDFLKKLMQAYGGCGEDVAAEVAEAVAKKYDCGRAVLAALTADLLSRHNCNRGAVAEALEVAKHRAKKFIAEYIWYVLFNDDWLYADMHAPLILLRRFKRPSIEDAEEFLINLGFPKTCIRRSLAVKWIVLQHCNLIDETIKDIAELRNLKGGLYNVMERARRKYNEHFKVMGYLE